MPEVGSVDFAVGIHVRLRKSRVNWSPEREQHAEVCTVNLAVDEKVRETLASIGNGVVVEVWRAGGNFARIADAVVVAIGLRWVGDSGAVIVGVGSTVAVGVEWWRSLECDGVSVARRNA